MANLFLRTCIVLFQCIVTDQPELTDEPRVLSHLYPGHHFGQYCLVTDDPRNANVVASTAVTCKSITRTRFEQLVQDEERFDTLMQLLVERTKQTRAQRKAVADQPEEKDVSFVEDDPDLKMSQDVFNYVDENNTEMINGYSVVRVLGKGAYGTVYLIQNRENALFALKVRGRGWRASWLYPHDDASSVCLALSMDAENRQEALEASAPGPDRRRNLERGHGHEAAEAPQHCQPCGGHPRRQG